MNRVFGVKSITHFIYGILLLIPFLSVLSRCVYVSVNKNSYESYYGETINTYEKVYINTYNDLVLYNDYIFTFSNISSRRGTGNKISVSNVEFIINNSPLDFSQGITHFAVSQYDNLAYLLFYNNDYAYPSITSTYGLQTTFKFKYEGTQHTNWTDYYDNNQWYYLQYNKYSYLDNVFEYSISTFLDENDNYSIDFFSWFTDLFLNQDTQHNALYLNFCNWYMNYALLVSTGYLLFFALLWFINYIRKILERSSYHDFGGF